MSQTKKRKLQKQADSIACNVRAWLVGGELAVPPMHKELKIPLYSSADYITVRPTAAKPHVRRRTGMKKERMTYKERQKAKSAAIKEGRNCYEGTCSRCKCKSIHIFVDNDLCFTCGNEDLEFEERRNALPYDPNDKEAAFRHEKSQQGWSDDRDEEIWNEHFRF